MEMRGRREGDVKLPEVWVFPLWDILMPEATILVASAMLDHHYWT